MTIDLGTTYLSEDKSTNGPEIIVVDIYLSPYQKGAYFYYVTLQNNGTGPITSGEEPHAWEQIYYELPLVAGIGTLEEGLINLDLNGDADKSDQFTVTWFHNASRQWDATIGSVHAYSFWEGSATAPWHKQSYYLNGKPKLFQLGTENHSLYFANETLARFGLGNAQILSHPSPNFELEVDSGTQAVSFQFDFGDYVPIHHTQTRERIMGGRSVNTTVYIIPGFGLDSGAQTTLSCYLLMNETKSISETLSMNWSPDGNNKKTWQLDEQEITAEAIERPFFAGKDQQMNQINASALEFTATIRNHGTPAVNGKLTISWENAMYEMEITGGEGILEESLLDLDLNGDGDESDTFPYTWFHNDTRQWDAIIHDGSNDIHTYAILDQDPSERWENFSYYLNNGQPKLFQLGNQTHSLYGVSSKYAAFGFGNVIFLSHPSPNFMFVMYAGENKSNIKSIDVVDFKINGEPVKPNLTMSLRSFFLTDTADDLKVYLIPNKAFTVTTGEEQIISATIIANETSGPFMPQMIVNWSPDGNRRFRWYTTMFSPVFFEINTKITMSNPPTTSMSTTPHSTPSFPYMSSISIVILTIAWNNRRKRR